MFENRSSVLYTYPIRGETTLAMRITTRVSSNYTVVVPEVLRKHLGITKGDLLEATVEGGAVVLRPVNLKQRAVTEEGVVEGVRERLARAKSA